MSDEGGTLNTDAYLENWGLRRLIMDRINDERVRQIMKEGFDHSHDVNHKNGELARAAGCYAIGASWENSHEAPMSYRHWPWEEKWWKPGDRERMLYKAAALIVAELERIAIEDRSSRPEPEPKGKQVVCSSCGGTGGEEPEGCSDCQSRGYL
jgi:hypothetical protein